MKAESVNLIDPKAIDHTTSPCEDFYQYSCGNWIKNTTIPTNKSIWDRGFNSGLPERNSKRLQDILD